MSDKIDREIDEILKRFDESGPEEAAPSSTASPRQTILSRPLRVSRRQVVFASLILTALIAAGLFFGPFHPSFGGSESSGSETSDKNVDERIGEGVDVDDTRIGESAGEGTETEDGEHGADDTDEEHDEHHEGSEH